MSTRAFTFLVNPLSGGGAATEVVPPVAERLRSAGAVVEVRHSTSPEECRPDLSAALGRGDVIVSVGGDGMLSSVAGEVASGGGTLGILPAGRGNDFARMVGMSQDPDTLAELLLEGDARPTDLLSLRLGAAQPRIVAGSVYSGVDAIASEIVDRVRWMPRQLQYPYAAVHSLATYRPVEAHVVVDGVAHDFRAATVVVANSGYYGSGMQIAPSATVDDGLLDVVVIEAASRRGLIKSLPKVYDGAHVKLPEVHVLQGRDVEISGSPSVPMGGDGEPLGALPESPDAPARIGLLPAALDLIRP